MTRRAHARKYEPRSVPAWRAVGESGVRCLDAAEPIHETPNEYSTVRAPRSSTLEGDGAADMYAQIVAGKLASVGEQQHRRRLLSSRAATRDQFLALGSLEHIPVRTCSAKELLAASIDHRQGFVLSLVDGATPIQSIIDASPQAMHQVLSALTELLGLGLIGFRS
jgi:hypothetical protein